MQPIRSALSFYQLGPTLPGRQRESPRVQITPGRFLREKALAPDGLTQEELAEAMMCCADCERQRPTNDHRRRWALRLETLTRVSAEMRLTCNRRSIFRGRSPRLC